MRSRKPWTAGALRSSERVTIPRDCREETSAMTTPWVFFRNSSAWALRIITGVRVSTLISLPHRSGIFPSITRGQAPESLSAIELSRLKVEVEPEREVIGQGGRTGSPLARDQSQTRDGICHFKMKEFIHQFKP